ncbi:HAD family hydrolase [Streptomyces reniochalinae]|uniref:HAD family hydrolase n=1 Tax=Streptomyces reniochalinae TaxID=2250578 RepID=A0A367EXZ7_9ACTN|nr:HAD family hydrolase [Streptomyces reniochalinae]RCG22267.1 HAD family hydrolase [Streptomyces reniochalinae]
MPRAALFDVDGTLTDTTYLHVHAWWEALRQAGHKVPTATLHRAIGLGARDLIAHVLGEGRDSGQDEMISAAHKTLFATCHERLGPLEGARELLHALYERGWQLVLVTSAVGGELAAMRRALDVDDLIAHIASASDVERGKPAPDSVDQARERTGAAQEQTVFIGDSVWDMHAASRAGVTALGVLSGGIPRADLEEAGAQEIYEGPADLLTQLEESAYARLERET